MPTASPSRPHCMIWSGTRDTGVRSSVERPPVTVVADASTT